ALLLPLPGTGTAEIRFDFDCRAAAALGDGFAAAHAAGVSIYSADGEVLFALNEPVSADTLCSDGALGAVLCGDELLLFTGGGPAGRIALPGPFLGVYCTGGYVALVTECAGYDCLVSVYAGDRPLFRRYIAHGVCRGAVLADGA